MTHPDLAAFGIKLGAAKTLDDGLMADLYAAMGKVFPDAPADAEGRAGALECVTHLMAHCLPGWSIHLTGQAGATDGHWRCGLRASDIRDDDDLVGTADGPTIPLVLARAMVDVASKVSR